MITTNHGVAKAWAEGKQTEDRSGNGNMSHNGCGTLFSYSTPIGRRLEDAHGQPAFLITTKRYSVTTQGKHIGPAHRATGYKAFSVPFLGLPFGRATDMAEVHAGNLADYDERIEEERQRIKRARKFKSQGHLYRIIEEKARYQIAFNL